MFKINRLIGALLVILCASTANAQVQLSPSQPEFIFNANATAAPQTGTVYSIPASVNQLSWIITFASAPASHSTILEVSNDNSVWATVDTSTNVSGEARNVFIAARFVRATESARSGGGAITITVIGKSTSVIAPASGSSVGSLVSTGQFLAADGSVSAPGYGFAAEPSLGFYRSALSTISFANQNGSNPPMVFNPSGINLSNLSVLRWTNGTGGGTPDVGISRTAPANLAIGNGTQGDSSGVLSANYLRAFANISTSTNGSYSWNSEAKSRISSAADGLIRFTQAADTIGTVAKVDALPTFGSGFGTSPIITAGSTALAGQINVGTGGTATTGTINFAGTAFPNAPFCTTTPSAGTVVTTATATTTVLTLTTGTAWPASTLINWQCMSPK